jgi:hypothetical protein
MTAQQPQPGLALTVGEIRAAYDRGDLTAEEARRRLHESGLSPADASATVERWATEGRNWAAR